MLIFFHMNTLHLTLFKIYSIYSTSMKIPFFDKQYAIHECFGTLKFLPVIYVDIIAFLESRQLFKSCDSVNL